MGDRRSAETTICSYTFNRETIDQLKKEKHGIDWPVVYMLANNKDVYIGETSSAYERMLQHLDNPNRKKLKKAYIFYNDHFNKSAILDIENMLIEYVAADGLFVLQNKNDGQSKYHNYYERAFYQECFKEIWEKLRKLEPRLARKTLQQIENSDIFKFSPYKELTDEQYKDESILIKYTANAISNNLKKTFIVNGGAGTGKTVLAISFIKYITDLMEKSVDTTIPDDIDDIDVLTKNVAYRNCFNKKGRSLRIAFVVPVPAFRSTIKDVFKQIKSLKNVKVLAAIDLTKSENFDVVIVDEAHRLKRNNKLANYGVFNSTCRKLGLDPNLSTELDWIENKTNNVVILFYDFNQSVKMADINKESILKYVDDKDNDILDIRNQLRLKAGNDYIDIWRKIFNNEIIDNHICLNDYDENYDFKLFNNLKEMIIDVKIKDKEYDGLCRVVGGYSYHWNQRVRDKKKRIEDRKPDFEVQGNSYYWNFNRDCMPGDNEIGCVYTCQGYDYNVCGVLIGPDVGYDSKLKKVVYHPENFYDSNAKKVGNIKDTEQNIINAYMVLLTRGIKGTYLYIVDDKLREYVKEVFGKYLMEM